MSAIPQIREVEFPTEIDNDGVRVEGLSCGSLFPQAIWTLYNEMSLQYHPKRTEVYLVLDGELLVYRGRLYPQDLTRTVAELQETRIRRGDNILIERGIVHSPVNINSTPARVLELSDIIPYDHEDIIRIHDKHGRATFPGFKKGASIEELVKYCRTQYATRGRAPADS